MKSKLLFLVFIISLNVFSQRNDSIKHHYYYSLKELSDIKIATGSIKKEELNTAPSNITLITKQMIDERGYQTLVDVCEDIPGFDFMMYNDGGGEYPTYNMHRGMGDIGNPEILIMIDGIIQNNISFNWSLLWTYDNIFIDVDRIEIIQGPGSVMYGAQAFTGVIHIITDKDFSGVALKSSIGENQTYSNDFYLGLPIGEESKISVAFHKYSSQGDNGIGRYDPGNYFKNKKYPATILADYDSAGNYIQNYANSKSGLEIPNGFNTENNSFALRAKLSHKNSELGFFLADAIRGNASSIVAYKYDITNKDNTHHYRSFHSYLINNKAINSKLNLSSEIVVRATHILPDGGFKYLYQFPNLTKKYAAYGYQSYIEERIWFDLNENNVFSLGVKGSLSKKSERIVSLDGELTSSSTTSSSWDIAFAGEGLNQAKSYPVYWVKEAALFALWDKKWPGKFSSSAGLRYDYSTEYGDIINPRLAIDYNPKHQLGLKLMYGTAYRQPSIFELTSEFRGNPNLHPQKIRTTELEIHSLLLNNAIHTKFDVFYSQVDQLIGKTADSSKPAGERYENIDERYFSGFTININGELFENVNLYSNYNFLAGSNDSPFELSEIERVARHKINAGINIKAVHKKLVTDLRMNYVGKRKAHTENTWLQTYENGYAPSYTKFNGSVSYNIAKNLNLQLICNNLLNTKYYGHGRETGSGFIDDYNYLNNVNPSGHIPAYHPQPGRSFLINITLTLDYDG